MNTSKYRSPILQTSRTKDKTKNMSDHNDAQNSEEAQPRGWEALRQHVIDHKVDVALWATRVFTILFTFGYFIPLLG
jgi:hypothetical protein